MNYILLYFITIIGDVWKIILKMEKNTGYSLNIISFISIFINIFRIFFFIASLTKRVQWTHYDIHQYVISALYFPNKKLSILIA